MKSILTIFLFFGFVVSSFSQTRNVVVDTNGVVLQPTNIWTANATNVRSGLGLGSAATNPASAFQSSSATLSNLASSNGVNLTNISVSGVVGALSTNGNGFGLTNLNASNITGVIRLTNVPTLSFTNISGTLAIASGGTGATNAAGARTNLGIGATWLTNTNVANFRSAIGLGANEAPTFYSISFTPSEAGVNAPYFDKVLYGDLQEENDGFAIYGGNSGLLAQFSDGGVTFSTNVAFQASVNFQLPSQTRASLGFSTNLNTLWTATTSSDARSAVGLGQTNSVEFSRIAASQVASSGVYSLTLGQTNTGFRGIGAGPSDFGYYRSGTAIWDARDANLTIHQGLAFATASASAVSRTNLGLGAPWLTNTSDSFFRAAIGLGSTNAPNFAGINIGSSAITYGGTSPEAFRISVLNNELLTATTNTVAFNTLVTAQSFSSSVGANSVSITNTGILFQGVAIANTRTNLGLGATWLTNTNATNFRADIGLGSNNSVQFSNVFITNSQAGNSTNYMLSIGAPDTGFTGVGGPVGSVNFRAGGTTLWTASSTGSLEFPAGARLRNALDFQYGGGALGVISFSGIDSNTGRAISRTNLGLGWPALTNTNAGTSLVSVNNNGEVVSPTNFWQVAPIQTLVQDLTVVVTSQTNNAVNARNLYIYSLSPNVSGISNTIILPTNTSTFNGDEITVIHRGTTNTVTVVRQDGSTNNLITLNKFDESIKFIREFNQWDFYHNISFVEPIKFSGNNVSENIAITRTNLELGSTNTVTFGNINIATNGIISISANGTNTVEVNIGSQGIEFNGDKTNGLISFVGANLASAFRSDIGLPLAALTNTNTARFQEAIFTTNTTPTNTANVNSVGFNTAIAWMAVNIVTNGVTNTFHIPLFK